MLIDYYDRLISYDECKFCLGKEEKRRYQVGYIRYKWCKVRICVGCGRVEYLGKRWMSWLYWILRAVMRNRLEVEATIEI